MKFICSLLVVEDVNKSRSLYEGILGQVVLTDFGENVSFEGGFSIHEKVHYESLICRHKVGKNSNCHELYFEHDDLAGVVELLKKDGMTFIHGIVEQPWKQRVVRFYDYDNHIIEIGESMEHVASRLHQNGSNINEICKITYLSEDNVREAIANYSPKKECNINEK